MKMLNIYENFFKDSVIGKVSLFLSVMALFFAVSMGETKCLSAQSCSVGDDEVFEGNLEIRSTNAFGSTLKSTATANNIEIELPNVDGRLLGVPTSFFPMGSNLFLKTDGTGALTLEALSVQKTDIDGSQGTNGQFLTTDGTQNGASWSNIPSLNETTFDASNGTNGQILTVNATGSLDFSDISGGGGSFQAIASQNVTHGAVGLDSNGQVRNITTLQNQSNSLQLSSGTVSSQPNSYTHFGFYNSNIDGEVIFYKDYDSANTSTCDTHFYVDVVFFNNTLQNYGRQCVSNEWSNIALNYTVNGQELGADGHGRFIVKRYAEEGDETSNDYVVAFTGELQDGQLWAVPVSVDVANSSLILGSTYLIHDENVCYNSGSCSSNNTAMDTWDIHDMAFTSGQDDKLYLFWGIYHSNSYTPNAYDISHKSFSCTSMGTPQMSCSPTNQHKYTSQTTFFRQYSQSVYPEFVWDKTAQVFMGFAEYNNYDCRIAQFRLNETGGAYNQMSMSTYGSSADQIWSSGFTYSDQNGTSFTPTTPLNCRGYSYSQAVYDPDIDAWLFPVQGVASYNNYDTYETVYISVSADSVNLGSKPIVHGYSNINHALGLSGATDCSASLGFECKGDSYLYNGNSYYDTVEDKWYMYIRQIQKGSTFASCNDDYSSRCMAVYTFEMNPTTKLIDNSTMKEFVYQPISADSVYNRVDKQKQFIYRDRADNTLIAGYHHGQATTTPSESYHFMARAFAIPDNIDSLIGLVNQSGSATNQVTVYSVGAVVDGFTGLTIGESYFVDGSGNIGTSGTYEIGRAIATDKIYISKMR